MGLGSGTIAHIAKVVQWVNHPNTEFKSLATICMWQKKWATIYYKFLNAMMSGQDITIRQQVYDIAKADGVSQSELDTCIWSSAPQSLYRSNRDEAKTYGQNGTPWYLIIDTKTGKYTSVIGAQPAESFANAIASLNK
jgi:predicted DsbA family dithiol-disulfide isomerase